MNRRQAALGLLAAILAAHVMLGPFRRGFQRMETDFPNYYTAARLTAHHLPLRQFYEWVWFQRQIHYAGIDHQLGGYVPHTPLTMLPFLPLIGFAPQHAKQIWLVLQLVLFVFSVVLLASASGLRLLEVLVLALLAHTALSNNLQLGQYYIFVLWLLAAGCWCLVRNREYTGGALLGLIFALKLYTAPFVVYFVARRQWKGLAGFIGAAAVSSVIAVVIFGWNDVWFFVNTVMSRGIDGTVNDPYNPGWESMTAFLRRTLIAEPELNPHPVSNSPGAFFFLRSVFVFGVLGMSFAALAKSPRKRDAQALAWFVIVLFLLSPNEASYHFVLLLVPIALLLNGAGRQWSIGLIALYIAVEIPLFSWDARFFPRAWLLLGLFFYAGWPHLRELRHRTVSATMLAVCLISAIAAYERIRIYRDETAQTSRPALVQPDGIYSSSPVFGGNGWMHEAIEGDRYVLRQWTPAGTRTLRFEGDAFHPAQSQAGRAVALELVAAGHSRICIFDPDTGTLLTAIGDDLDPTEPALSPDGAKLAFIARDALYVAEAGSYREVARGAVMNPAFFPDGEQIVFAKGQPGRRSLAAMPLSGGSPRTLVDSGDCFEPSVSPDGTFLAFTCSATGGRHIWVQELGTRKATRLTSGFCNNDAPAWDRDSKSIVFASDCSRGLGLPALYRLRLPRAL